MKFLSVCSGIEAASVAWNPLGWKAVAFSEIEPFPCAVLAHHYPDTPNWGDMTKYKEWPDVPIDLLCGGTPCQSFSVAGLRKGLDDPRGNLMLTFGAIAAKYRPKWLVWENVPGVLSSNKGRDFGAFLGMLGQLRYGFAYRVLDAQFFGVPQRRRRVFVVGCLGDWRSAAAVLFERHGLSGNPAPSRQARKRIAPTLSARAQGGGGLGTDFDCDGGLVAGTLSASGKAAGSATQQDAHAGLLMPVASRQVAGSLTSSYGKQPDSSDTALGPSLVLAFDSTQITSPENGSHPMPGGPCHPQAARAHPPAIAFDSRQDPVASEHLFGALSSSSPQAQAVTTLAIRGRGDSHQLETRSDGTANALLTPNGGRAGIGVGAIHYGMQVRRLTPEECEALQAYPRGYTRIPWRGKPAADCPDGPRYKALGNSWCTTNARWVGERIDRVNSIFESA